MIDSNYHVPCDVPNAMQYLQRRMLAAPGANLHVSYRDESSLVFGFNQELNWAVFFILFWLCIVPAVLYAMLGKKSGQGTAYFTPSEGGTYIRVQTTAAFPDPLLTQALAEMGAQVCA